METGRDLPKVGGICSLCLRRGAFSLLSPEFMVTGCTAGQCAAMEDGARARTFGAPWLRPDVRCSFWLASI